MQFLMAKHGQMQFIDDKTWEALKTRGLHFCHLNVNSLLSKVEET